MATLFLGRDTRRERKYPKCPLCIRITHKDIQRYILLGLNLTSEQWSKEKQAIQNYPNFKAHNSEVQRKWHVAQAYLLKLEPQLDLLTPEGLKELIEQEINKELIEAQNELAMTLNLPSEYKEQKHSGAMLGAYAQRWIDLKLKHQKRKTAMWYKDGIVQFLYFVNGNKGDLPKRKWGAGENFTIDLTFDFPIAEITPALLNKFALHLQDFLKHKPNGIGARLRAISSIIGKAILEQDETLLPKDYRTPFDFIKIPGEKTKKRGLRKDYIEVMRKQEYEIHSPLWNHKNYFLFMFNLKGMNWIDIAKLQMKQISNGRLDYTRSKTGRHYSIQLTPEANTILGHYIKNKGSEDYVFPILPHDLKNDGNEISRVAEQARNTHNDYLKTIQKDCNIPVKLTTYVTRHSWADIAKKMGISIDMIKEGLGHEKTSTTEIYLDSFDDDVNDEVNLRVTA